jgi:uncharacterized protein YndB with AHSA1/START domain
MAKTAEAAGGEAGSQDLTITRRLAAPRALVWRAWSSPEHLKKWWTPAPWTTPECEMDLKPGGRFHTLMRGPDGTEHDNEGCFLEVVEAERIVWTDALGGGYRPREKPFITAIITLADEDGGTRYTALVLHKDKADRDRHEEMGFLDGWGTCIDQLGQVASALGGRAR